MIRAVPLLALSAAVAAVPALAAPGGRIETLPVGRYLCELPGDASGPASVPVDGQWFDIVNATTYASDGGEGTYLATEAAVTFTRGPMKGASFVRASTRTLKRTDLSGKLAALRCVLTGRQR
jgi:hypothetical protein